MKKFIEPLWRRELSKLLDQVNSKWASSRKLGMWWVLQSLRLCITSFKALADALVVLILKVENLSYITHYRPISLCYAVFKLVTKTLASRIEGILVEVISPN